MWKKFHMSLACKALARGCEPQKTRLTKKTPRLFGEEFHTLIHIFLCIENANGLQVQNGHIEFSMALAKLVGIIPILICQNPFYKTSSIPKL
jgi:3,4-dihydroxy-2-butanone 4-phosphate synthase